MSDARVRLYADGASRGNPGLGGAGSVFKDENGNLVGSLKKYIGHCTNNEAEYQALILGLEEAVRRGYNRLDIFLDSELVVKQVTGAYRVKSKSLLKYIIQVRNLLSLIRDYKIAHIDRRHNQMADRLANEAIDEHFESRR
jgi:ribonuclease HI